VATAAATPDLDVALGLDTELVAQLRTQSSLRDGHLTPSVRREGGSATDNAEDDEWFLILEDDAYVCERTAKKSSRDASLGMAVGGASDAFPAAVRNALDALPSDADILYLGRAVPSGNKAWGKPHKGGLVQLNYVWQLHAYLIPRHTARRLLKELPVDCPADNFLARLIHEGSLTAYTLEQQLVRQPTAMADRSHTDIAHSGRMLVEKDPGRRKRKDMT
jgi:hypothetical protein